MGCNASKLDSLPAVSLCHHRFHLIDDSLRHSYSFAESHLSYLNSLHSFPTALLSFLRHNSTSTSTSDSPPNTSDDNTHSKSDSSSDLNFSSSSSDSLSDDDDHKPEFGGSNAYDFHHPKYDSYQDGGSGRGDFPYSWKTPSPPPPRVSSAWDFLNFFDAPPFERYDFAVKEKEEVNKNCVEAKPSEKKLDVQKKKKKSKNREAKDSCPKQGNPVEKKEEEKKKSDSEEMAKVMDEVEVTFKQAAESGNEVFSSLDAAGKSGGVSPLFEGFDGDESGVSSLNLSSTLSRLCMWEKKLYDEVKAEEKLRMAYARYCNKVRKGLGDTSKPTDRIDESVRATLRTLAIQIQVGIQVIDRISTNINKLRDEELFPQLTHLILKLFGMWKSMLESHKAQFQVVSEAQSRNLLALSSTKLTDAGVESAIQLKIELHSLALRFISWISSQKQCVKSLNGWLVKCLLPDKPAEKQLPAEEEYPPVFALCEKWSNSLDAISETEVVSAVQSLLGAVNKLLEQQRVHVQERVTADKEMERKVKALEREEQRLKKLLQGHGIGKVLDRKAGENEDFESGLKQVFKAIERFSASSFKAYQQLHAQIEVAEKPQEISSSSQEGGKCH
ncbi:Protein ALTERED PHOSPHATE STARVATION RESPONSE 1 [Linum perenne]